MKKINFETFMLEYKHGLYIFSGDACQLCKDYEESLNYIKSPYLVSVEVVTDEEIQILESLTNRSVFPMSVGYKDNKLEFVRIGFEKDLQMSEVLLPFLESFPNIPLTQEEIERRISESKKTCKIVFYIFSEDIEFEDKMSWYHKKCFNFNELPILVSSTGVDLEMEKERLKLFVDEMSGRELIVFSNSDGIIDVGDFERMFIKAWMDKNTSGNSFEIRNINLLSR